ncbi:hypothetical protein [uncultured Nostoc sp.]
MSETIAHTQDKLAVTAIEHGGFIWMIDGFQPEGHLGKSNQKC